MRQQLYLTLTYAFDSANEGEANGVILIDIDAGSVYLAIVPFQNNSSDA